MGGSIVYAATCVCGCGGERYGVGMGGADRNGKKKGISRIYRHVPIKANWGT